MMGASLLIIIVIKLNSRTLSQELRHEYWKVCGEEDG